MRLWWAASFSVHEARIKRANFMTSFCSLWEASAMYDRTRDDRSHCRRAAAYRQSNRRSLTLVGLRDDAPIIPAGLVKLTASEAITSQSGERALPHVSFRQPAVCR